MPIVSVIVPNYNHAPYLRQRIDSILNQTFQDFELILLDDASTDDSREILETYRHNPHVTHVVYNDNNSGSPFAQWARGIALARGEWVWIAESDDYAEPTFLEQLLAATSTTPRCSLAFAATRWVDERGNHLWDTPDNDKTEVYEGGEFVRRRLAVNNSIANVSQCIFRRSCYRPSESYRYDRMRLCGDWFFYVLLAEEGDVVELHKPLSFYRQHNENLSSDAERQGLTFTEGINVLDYMTTHCGVHPSDYAKGWGRLWAKYEHKYSFDTTVRSTVRHCIAKHHKLIVLFYILYKLRKPRTTQAKKH